MAENEAHIGDIGTAIIVTLMDGDVILPIQSASVMEIILEKSDSTQTKVIKTAVFVTDGSDGKMQYITVDKTDLDVCGNWKIQGFVTLPTGSWSSYVDSFKILGNL